MAVPAVQALEIFDSGFLDRINSVIPSKNSRPSEHLAGLVIRKICSVPHYR
jgi:hypothetical protein